MTETSVAETKSAPAMPAVMSAGIGPRGIVLRDMADLWSFAAKVFESKFVPNGIKSVEETFIALEIGLECGLSPMQALQGTAVINGKPSLYGDIAKGICLASPLREYIVCNPIEGTTFGDDDYGYRCEAKRKNHPPVVREFTIADAKLANLWGKKSSTGKPSPWVLYPKRMLMWRPQSWAMRDAFADVLHGISIYEDIQSQDIQEPRDVTHTQPGGDGSQLAKLLSDPKPDTVVVTEATEGTGPVSEQPPEAETEAPEEEAPAEEETPAEEPEPLDGSTFPMTLDDEGLRNLSVEAKIPKKLFAQMVTDVGMGVGIKDAVISELNDEGRQLLESAIRDYKAKK